MFDLSKEIKTHVLLQNISSLIIIYTPFDCISTRKYHGLGAGATPQKPWSEVSTKKLGDLEYCQLLYQGNITQFPEFAVL
jgi:hypothetical protein